MRSALARLGACLRYEELKKEVVKVFRTGFVLLPGHAWGYDIYCCSCRGGWQRIRGLSRSDESRNIGALTEGNLKQNFAL